MSIGGTDRELLKAIEGVKELVDSKFQALVEAKKKKIGSALSTQDVNDMEGVSVPFSIWSLSLKSNSSVSLADIATQLINLRTAVERDSKMKDEVENVQEKVHNMLVKILEIPIYENLIAEREKDYHVIVPNSGTEVTGVTDHVIRIRGFSDFSVATGESKNSKENLQQKKNVAQFLAELLAEHEKILRLRVARPKEMCGVLTNGKDWMLGRRFFYDGRYCLQYSFVDSKDSECCMKVACFVIHMLQVSLEITTEVLCPRKLPGIREDALDGDEEMKKRDDNDEEDEGNDHDEEIGKSTSIFKIGSGGKAERKGTKHSHSVVNNDPDSYYFIARLTEENLRRYAVR
jgi:hypothetical protein